MRTATWTRTDPDVGKRVRLSQIIIWWFISLLFTFGVTYAAYVIHLAVFGQFHTLWVGMMLMVGLLYNSPVIWLFGSLLALAGLRTGRFGYLQCLAAVLLLIVGVAIIAFVSIIKISDLILWGALIGVPAATVFWLNALASFPELAPPEFGRFNHVDVAWICCTLSVAAGLVVMMWLTHMMLLERL